MPEFSERSYLLAGAHFFVCDALALIDLEADLTTIGALTGSSTSEATGTSWNGPSHLQVCNSAQSDYLNRDQLIMIEIVGLLQ